MDREMNVHMSSDKLGVEAVKKNIMESIQKAIAIESGEKYMGYSCKRRVEKDKTDHYRKGPAPIEESDTISKSTTKATYGTLDSDVEDLDFEDVRHQNSKMNYYNKLRVTTNEKGDNLASCRALIIYFSKLAKSKDEEELIDLNFVESLLDNGADINFPDKHGQTIFHEVARGWHPDIAKFAIEHGADVNKCDTFGRTPLHLAAAVDYDDMVQFLVDNGADLGAKTFAEEQTAMHYAAKNNAASSLKVMLRLGARINDRDYKRRTPLFVAAETARTEAARFLIEHGAPAGVYDCSGTSCLSLMIEKMPQIAVEAVEQFHLLDLAFRKHYYYLSYLEPDPNFLVEYIPEEKRERKELEERKKAEKKLIKNSGQKIVKKEKSYAKTPLEVIVQCDQMDIIMHPVFQRLLHVKWNLFGKRGSAKMLILNFVYTLIWTILGIMIPRDHKYYLPFADNWWRLILEMMGVSMTIYFIFMEISQVRNNEKKHNNWRQWRTRHMEKDLDFCHPRWPEEKQYLSSELLQIRGYQRTYFRDPWNIFEWVSYIVVLTLVLTRILSVASGNHQAEEIHPKVYAIGLIVIWLRFMRSCRVFQTLGPFIAILGSVIIDTAKFSFLLFEFFVPYTVGFWIIFGGEKNQIIMNPYSKKGDWEQFNDLTFSVFSMTLMGNYDWDGLVAVDRLMAQILCGSYLALSGVVCMNLYIALLSDTFARVYAQAKANAVMQQAKFIITLEGKLNKFYRSKYAHFMLKECSPQEVYTRDEGNSDDHEHDMLEKISRQILNRIDNLEEGLTFTCKQIQDELHEKESAGKCNTGNTGGGFDGYNSGDGGSDGGGRGSSMMRRSQGFSSGSSTLGRFIEQQHSYNVDMKREIGSLKHLLTEVKSLFNQQQKEDPQRVETPPINNALRRGSSTSAKISFTGEASSSTPTRSRAFSASQRTVSEPHNQFQTSLKNINELSKRNAPRLNISSDEVSLNSSKIHPHSFAENTFPPMPQSNTPKQTHQQANQQISQQQGETLQRQNKQTIPQPHEAPQLNQQQQQFQNAFYPANLHQHEFQQDPPLYPPFQFPTQPITTQSNASYPPLPLNNNSIEETNLAFPPPPGFPQQPPPTGFSQQPPPNGFPQQPPPVNREDLSYRFEPQLTQEMNQSSPLIASREQNLLQLDDGSEDETDIGFSGQKPSSRSSRRRRRKKKQSNATVENGNDTVPLYSLQTM